MTNDIQMMDEAIRQAEKAEAIGEVPIGAVIEKDGVIVAAAHNLRESKQDPTAHAEIIAIKEASRKIGSWRLGGCRLFVTLEPCPMCAGAIIQSRIETLVFGASDPKAGCCGTLMNLPEDSRFNHRTTIVSGIQADTCASLLTDFFRKLRGK